MAQVSLLQRIVEDISGDSGKLDLPRHEFWFSELSRLGESEQDVLLRQLASLAQEAAAVDEPRLAQRLAELASILLDPTLRPVHFPARGYWSTGVASFASRVPRDVVASALSRFTTLETVRMSELGPEGRIMEHLRVRTKEHPDLIALENIAEQVALEVYRRPLVALRDSKRWGLSSALHPQAPPQRDFGPHIDFQGTPEAPTPLDKVSIQVMVYLTDVDQECGPTTLWLGSAKLLRRIASKQSLRFRHQLMEHYSPVAKRCARVSYLARAGDCLALDHLCLHSMVSNVSTLPRVAFRFPFVAV